MKFLIVARLTCERLFGFLFVFATNTNACCLHIYSMYSYSRYTGEKKHGIGKFTWLIGLSEGEREKKREWQQQRLSPINARSLIAVRLLNRAFTRRVRYSGNAEHSTFVLSEFLGILWKKKTTSVCSCVGIHAILMKDCCTFRLFVSIFARTECQTYFHDSYLPTLFRFSSSAQKNWQCNNKKKQRQWEWQQQRLQNIRKFHKSTQAASKAFPNSTEQSTRSWCAEKQWIHIKFQSADQITDSRESKQNHRESWTKTVFSKSNVNVCERMRVIFAHWLRRRIMRIDSLFFFRSSASFSNSKSFETDLSHGILAIMFSYSSHLYGHRCCLAQQTHARTTHLHTWW